MRSALFSATDHPRHGQAQPCELACGKGMPAEQMLSLPAWDRVAIHAEHTCGPSQALQQHPLLPRGAPPDLARTPGAAWRSGRARRAAAAAPGSPACHPRCWQAPPPALALPRPPGCLPHCSHDPSLFDHGYQYPLLRGPRLSCSCHRFCLPPCPHAAGHDYHHACSHHTNGATRAPPKHVLSAR